MPRKKELPAPDSGEQDDLLSAETQELPDTLLPMRRSPSRRRNPSPQKAHPMRARRRMIRRPKNTRNFFRH